MKKTRRLQLIKEMIARRPIGTQEEIVDGLKAQGIVATQATVSRDIKELGITKVPTKDKGYIYGLPKSSFSKIKLKNVISIAAMDNMIHVNTVPGSSSAIKRHILEQFSEQIFSILADDDSILMIVKEAEELSFIQQTIEVW